MNSNNFIFLLEDKYNNDTLKHLYDYCNKIEQCYINKQYSYIPNLSRQLLECIIFGICQKWNYEPIIRNDSFPDLNETAKEIFKTYLNENKHSKFKDTFWDVKDIGNRGSHYNGDCGMFDINNVETKSIKNIMSDIFYLAKWYYKYVIESYKELENYKIPKQYSFEELQDTNKKLQDENENLKNEILDLQKGIDDWEFDYNELEQKYKEKNSISANSNDINEINQLKNKNSELKAQQNKLIQESRIKERTLNKITKKNNELERLIDDNENEIQNLNSSIKYIKKENQNLKQSLKVSNQKIEVLSAELENLQNRKTNVLEKTNSKTIIEKEENATVKIPKEKLEIIEAVKYTIQLFEGLKIRYITANTITKFLRGVDSPQSSYFHLKEKKKWGEYKDVTIEEVEAALDILQENAIIQMLYGNFSSIKKNKEILQISSQNLNNTAEELREREHYENNIKIKKLPIEFYDNTPFNINENNYDIGNSTYDEDNYFYGD